MLRGKLAILMVLVNLGILFGFHGLAGAEELERGLPRGWSRPQGIHALTVRPQLMRPFSKEDVIGYFTAHKLSKNSGLAGEFAVDNLEFLTSKEVSRRLRGVSTGLHDNEYVGFATLTGKFVITGPPGSKPMTFSRAYTAFDATTGNLLMFGTLPPTDAPE